MADRSLCGHGGSAREQKCQLLKLTILAIIPGLILIVRDAVNVAANVKTLQDNREVQSSILFSVEISAVIHAMQIERGTTALYVSSKGDPFVRPRLLQLYIDTDNAITVLSRWIPIKRNNFDTKENFLQHIIEFREKLSPKNATLREVIGFYTDDNAAFIRMIGKSLNLEKPFEFWTDIVSYQMLIFSKEQAGIERALGSTYFARDEDLLWYSEKNVLGHNFLQQSLQYSDFTDRLVNQMFKGSLLEEDLSIMRRTILNNTVQMPSVVFGTIWFDNMTEYINILKTIQDRLANTIVQSASDENRSLEESLVLSAIEFTVAVIMVPIIIMLVRKIISRIHGFSQELKEKTFELNEERKRTEELLYQLLPRTIAKRLMEDGSTIPEAYHSATIMFSDVLHYPDARDGYMVASGIPGRNGERHVEEIAKLSLDLLITTEQIEVPHLENEKIRLRVGFNTGPCVAGVVGIKMPRYCIFGDTVNTASRMESTGLPSKVQMSESSANKLKKVNGFRISERGIVEVKGKGVMRTYWLDGCANSSPQRSHYDTISSNVSNTSDVHTSNNDVTMIIVQEKPIYSIINSLHHEGTVENLTLYNNCVIIFFFIVKMF
ncbi:GCY17-like protein [Mya arenaria]|uniref:guanylate cyclase n=1 Tax=Mya arenaria TaxID=6604 RepID=A0ABY7EYT5_MYAAR|nr:GCY17-like protein [Mya arenaria]